MDTGRIAVQLYTLRELTAQDMLGTLRQLAEQGYRAVEFARYGNSSPQEIRPVLDELGIKAVAGHIGLDDLKNDAERTLGDLETLGCSYAVVAYIAEERRGSVDQVREIADSFNRNAQLCKSSGLRFAYHNHAFEFEPLDGTTMFDVLVAETDSSLVNFELDVFWAKYAGADPVETLGRLKGRVPLLHAKDMAGDETRADRPVGDGVLPWSDIFRAGDEAGVEWYIVEQDHPSDALPDVGRSLSNMRGMGT